MTDFTQQTEDYRRIEKAIRFIENNFKSQPSLEQIAASVNLSKFHFNRLFKRFAGISPIRFLHFLTVEYTKKQLANACSILDASLDAGLSGPGRLHDLFLAFETMTPGTYKKKGAGLNIEYGFCHTLFGECLLAITDKGICHLGFIQNDNSSSAFNDLRQYLPEASLEENPSRIIPIVEQIFNSQTTRPVKPLHLHIKGTNFQINVWRALLSIPQGRMSTYNAVAARIGRPKAYRAVAGAIANNPVGFLIPCHRVIAASGVIHKYRWGSARKKAILGWEASQMLREGD